MSLQDCRNQKHGRDNQTHYRPSPIYINAIFIGTGILAMTFNIHHYMFDWGKLKKFRLVVHQLLAQYNLSAGNVKGGKTKFSQKNFFGKISVRLDKIRGFGHLVITFDT
jgi:hypothetical protein